MKATLRLVGVDLNHKVYGQEPYVTAIAVCESTAGAVPLSVLPGKPEAAPVEPAPVMEPGGATSGPRPRHMDGVTVGHSLELDAVLFEGDPGGWLVVRAAVMDSDHGHERAGARLDESRHLVDGSSLGLALGTGLLAPTVVASLAGDVAGLVGGLLATYGDRVLIDFTVRIDNAANHPHEITVDTLSSIARLTWTVEGAQALTVEDEAVPQDVEARGTVEEYFDKRVAAETETPAARLAFTEAPESSALKTPPSARNRFAASRQTSPPSPASAPLDAGIEPEAQDLP